MATRAVAEPGLRSRPRVPAPTHAQAPGCPAPHSGRSPAWAKRGDPEDASRTNRVRCGMRPGRVHGRRPRDQGEDALCWASRGAPHPVPSDPSLAGLPVHPDPRGQEGHRAQCPRSAEGQGHLTCCFVVAPAQMAPHALTSPSSPSPRHPRRRRGQGLASRALPAPWRLGPARPEWPWLASAREARQAYLRYMPMAYAHRKE